MLQLLFLRSNLVQVFFNIFLLDPVIQLLLY